MCDVMLIDYLLLCGSLGIIWLFRTFYYIMYNDRRGLGKCCCMKKAISDILQEDSLIWPYTYQS